MARTPAVEFEANTAASKSLQAAIQRKLKDFLGPDYTDEVLAQYVMIMLVHGNNSDLIAENLIAFLGESQSPAFTNWLFDHIERHKERYSGESDGKKHHSGHGTTKHEREVAAAKPSSSAEEADKNERQLEKLDSIETSGKKQADEERHMERQRSSRSHKGHRDSLQRTGSHSHSHKERKSKRERGEEEERTLEWNRSIRSKRSKHDRSLRRRDSGRSPSPPLAQPSRSPEEQHDRPPRRRSGEPTRVQRVSDDAPVGMTQPHNRRDMRRKRRGDRSL